MKALQTAGKMLRKAAAKVAAAVPAIQGTERAADPWLSDLERREAINARRDGRWLSRHRRGWLR